MSSRAFVRLVGIAVIIVALWTIFGIFTSNEFYRRVLHTGANKAWAEVFYYQMAQSTMWAFFTPIAVFIAERLPLRKPHRLRNGLLLLATAPLFSVIRTAFGSSVQALCESGRVSAEFVMLSINIRFHRNLFLYLIVVGIVNLILLQRSAAAREREALAMRTALMNAELQRLRTSRQPRLMFATLDAIEAKVMSDPDGADRLLVRLGELLRAMLDFSKRPSVTLAEELEVIDRFLEIEKERTPAPFTTRMDVDEELLSARIPPLLLNTLLEPVMHGNGDTPRQLEIYGRAERGILIIEIRSDDPPRTQPAAVIDGTRRRLHEAFGERASIAWRKEERGSLIELSIPLEREASA